MKIPSPINKRGEGMRDFRHHPHPPWAAPPPYGEGTLHFTKRGINFVGC